MGDVDVFALAADHAAVPGSDGAPSSRLGIPSGFRSIPLGAPGSVEPPRVRDVPLSVPVAIPRALRAFAIMAPPLMSLVLFWWPSSRPEKNEENKVEQDI